MEEITNEDLKKLEEAVPAEPTVEQLKEVIIQLVSMMPKEEGAQRFSRCHPDKCPLAWMWPVWHPTPPHVQLYPSDWC